MSKTVIAEIKDNKFPPLKVSQGTHVVWKNLDPYAHSVEAPPGSSFFFNGGALLPGEHSSPVLFYKEGSFPYLCRFHMDMTGVVEVGAVNSESHENHDHGEGHAENHGHHLKHFHGFVTGGRSGRRLYMTHTPVLADERHHYQVILLGSLVLPEHVTIYDRLRASAYGNGRVQIFHDHLSLPDIGAGKITELPEAEFAYYPVSPDVQESIPGLEEKIRVRIDKVIHFHQFQTDAPYPSNLKYVMYGDEEDTFIDHYIDRAPSFHSVARLKTCPTVYKGKNPGDTLLVSVENKPILDVSPKSLSRVAFVDNAFHLFWLPPPGVYPRTTAQDPLLKRDGSAALYSIETEDGTKGTIEIASEGFIHFDVRLLNYGVLIT